MVREQFNNQHGFTMSITRWMQRVAIIAVLAVNVPVTLLAQDSTTTKQGRLCWRGQPLPVCSTILLTEFGVYGDLVTPSARRTYPGSEYEVHDARWDLQAELGLLKNINQKYAFGGSVLLRYSHMDGHSLGVKARYRRWLTPDGISLDVGAGVRAGRDPAPVLRQNATGGIDYSYGRSPTLTTDVAFNVMDYASFVARTDVVKFSGQYKPKVSVGVRGGSRVGTFGFAGFGTTIAILAAVFLATFDT